MGLFRVVLASLVVVAHLTEGTPWTSHLGVFAVCGFYVLSGYLITRVLNDVYAFDGVAFWTNRVLRLFPIYYVTCIFALSLIVSHPSETATFLPSAWAGKPASADWIGALTIVPFGVGSWPFRPVPSIWSVGVELMNYALLFAFTARRRSFAIITFALAVGLHAASCWNGESWGFRYAPAYAAALPFSIGALLYFATRNTGRAGLSPVVFAVTAWAGGLALTALTGGIRPTAAFDGLFYLNILTVAALVAALVTSRAPDGSAFDKAVGELAYPVFLVHWIVGFALSQTVFGGQTRGGWLALATLAGALVLAWALCQLQDAIVEPLRRRIRPVGPRAASTPSPTDIASAT